MPSTEPSTPSRVADFDRIGVGYSQIDNAYTSAGIRDLATFYDASGNVVASESFPSNGGYTVTVGGVVTQQETVN